MKKDRNNRRKSPDKDFSLPRAKILRGRKKFQRLFQKDAVTLRSASVDLKFCLLAGANGGCQIGFIVSKRLGKATKRNRIKRLMREAFRLNQYILTPLFEHTSNTFHGVLIAKSIDMEFDTVQEQVVGLLHRAREHLLPLMKPGS